MNIYKRIISLSVAFAMCISLMIAPVSATELVPSGQYQLTNYSRAFALGAISDLSFDYIQNIGGYLSTLWEAMKTGSCDGCSANPADGRHNFLPRDGYMITWEAGLKGNAACDCQYCGITFDEFFNSTYNQYVSDLQSDWGTSWISGSGVFIIPCPISRLTAYNATMTGWDGSMMGVATSATVYLTANGTGTPCVAFNSSTDWAWMAPCDGQFMRTYVSNYPVDYEAHGSDPTYFDNWLSIPVGRSVKWAYSWGGNAYITPGVLNPVISFSPIILFKPCESNPIFTDISSRPTSIIGNYGIIGDDGAIVKVDGNMIVDESTSTVFNPVTNVTNNYTDYVFDYSDRSYNLTLEDGSTLKVVYGDENVTIYEGDTVYNVYYLLPDSSEDPGGSGGSGDTPGTDDGSGWAWLQGAWTQMLDKLSQIREAIVGLELSPEINVEVEVEGEEQVTQEAWFTDVLSKFSFLSSIRDIYSQLIADVTSDAATAAAVADGEIMLADVTTGHAATDGRASYTAPELAISFGSSDKYGVDWAGIRPLDLSWYAPYKETVDGILSGILWLSYLFLLIKRAPGIIRGSEMVTEDRIKIDMWRRHH